MVYRGTRVCCPNFGHVEIRVVRWRVEYRETLVPVGIDQLSVARVGLSKGVSVLRKVPCLRELTSGVVVHKLGGCKHLSMLSCGA